MRRLINILLLMLFSVVGASAQQLVDTPFNGLVVDGSGKGIAKVKITIAGSTKRTSTDKQGRFGLTNVPADAVLQFSYKKIEFEIPVNGRRSMRVILVAGSVSDVEESQELIDTGYGYVKRRELTQRSDVISGDELRSLGQMDLQEALLGVMPGLQLINGELSLRGSTSLNASTRPLILVDGMETTTLSTVSINEVESVSLDRDGSMYGIRGANGVILITLKGANK